MPIYEYKCIKCSTVTEKLQKINDEPLKFCEICKTDTLKKQISNTNFNLKGSGWFNTGGY